MNHYTLYPQDYYNEQWGSMKLKGAASLKVEPDMATLNLGIITEDKSLKTAQDENRVQSTAVLNSLLQMNVPKKHILTSSYQIEPQYDYIEGKQVFRSYKVSNILSVTIEDLSSISEVIDRSLSSGANQVDNISFSLEDPSAHYMKALTFAVENAVKKADQLTHALKIQLVKIPSKVTEISYSAPAVVNPMVKLSAGTPPILPGQISINAEIEAVFHYNY